MSIRWKLYLAFFAMILLALIIGVVSLSAFVQTQGMVEHAKQEITFVSDSLTPASVQLGNLATDTTASGLYMYAFTFNTRDSDYVRAMESLQRVDESLGKIEGILAGTAQNELQITRRDLPKVRQLMTDIREKCSRLNSVIRGLDQNETRVEGHINGMTDILNSLLAEAMTNLRASLLEEDLSGAAELPPAFERRFDRIGYIDELGDMLTSGQMLYRQGRARFGDEAEDYYQKAIAMLRSVADNVTKYANDPDRVGTQHQTREAFLNLIKEVNGYADSIVAFSNTFKQSDALNGEITRASRELLTLTGTLSDYTSGSMEEMTSDLARATVDIDTLVDRSAYICWIVVILAIAIGVVSALVITRSVTAPINRVIERLTAAEHDIYEATGKLDAASRALADGVTEQASNLAETSSAMEEMASMARQTADNTQRANDLTGQTARAVSAGSGAMDEMGRAMTDISESSDKVQDVIKTISDIAFQTNLLALNAAVEAARAGEAGKGFAVVADEVRNLSQRSAQAVRDTEALIQNTVESVRNGTAIAEKLATSFKDIESGTTAIGHTIESIANASQEQAQGVDQVNHSVAMMDKITQRNSEAATQTAGATSNLNQQVIELQENINSLTSIVLGEGQGRKPGLALTGGKMSMKALPGPRTGRVMVPEFIE